MDTIVSALLFARISIVLHAHHVCTLARKFALLLAIGEILATYDRTRSKVQLAPKLIVACLVYVATKLAQYFRCVAVAQSDKL